MRLTDDGHRVGPILPLLGRGEGRLKNPFFTFSRSLVNFPSERIDTIHLHFSNWMMILAFLTEAGRISDIKLNCGPCGIICGGLQLVYRGKGGMGSQEGNLYGGERLTPPTRVCGVAWSILGALGALDPDSNSGRPTTIHYHWVDFRPSHHGCYICVSSACCTRRKNAFQEIGPMSRP